MGISHTPHPVQSHLSPHEQVWAPPVQLQVDPQPQPIMKKCGDRKIGKIVIVCVGVFVILLAMKLKRTLETEEQAGYIPLYNWHHHHGVSGETMKCTR